MDKFPQRQGGVNIQRGFCHVVFRKLIPRGKTLTFWQKVNDLAKPILRGKSLLLSYLKRGKLTENAIPDWFFCCRFMYWLLVIFYD